MIVQTDCQILRYLSPLIPISLIVARVPHRRHWIASIARIDGFESEHEFLAASSLDDRVYVCNRVAI